MATFLEPLVLKPGQAGVVLHIPDQLKLSEDEFFDLCAVNRDLRIERTAHGDLIIMPPTALDTGDSNCGVSSQLWVWAKRDGTGRAFDSSTGFTLPNGAVRSPDASWILNTRLRALEKSEWERFAHICPDFVIELKSRSDALSFVQAKMQEYIDNGARLGWLIHPKKRQVHVYRPNLPVEILENVTSVSAEPELPGFTLDLTDIFSEL